MFMSWIGAFGSIVGEKKMCMYIGSLFMSYASVMNFIKIITIFMSLLASIAFNDSFGMPKGLC